MKLMNPKEYWSLINRESSQSEPEAEISTDALISYFKELSLDLNKDEIKCIPTRFEEYQNSNGLINPIRKDEFKKAMKHLKNNKACGRDELVNEFFKASQSKILDIYLKLFNLVLFSGIVPEVWAIGVIKPLYKQKVDIPNSENYRGITKLSCLGKLFTSILNNRLKDYMKKIVY